MHYFFEWLSILSISLLASMVPGMSFALVLKNTLHTSRQAGIWTAAGLALGMSFYLIIVLLGLSVIILHNPWLSQCIIFLSSLYLIYIGMQSIKAKPKIMVEQTLLSRSRFSSNKVFLTGVITNILNPKVMLFFLALFSSFIHPYTPPYIAWIYGATVLGVEFLWFSSVAVLLTQPALLGRFQVYAHWIERASGGLLLAIGLHLLLSLHVTR